MIASVIRLFLSATIALSPMAAHAVTDSPYKYIFRAKTTLKERPPEVVPEFPMSNNITAFFVAGVGMPFSQKLPVKADLQEGDWTVVSGSLPQGLSFDTETLLFAGTAETEIMGAAVLLEARDASGNRVAKAAVTFDVRNIQGVPVPVAFYGHAGHYVSHLISIPKGVVVKEWTQVYAPPEGTFLNGNLFDGTPAKVGDYPVMLIGSDYNGKVVATALGNYLVEEGPTFPLIPDDVRELSFAMPMLFDFGAPSKHKINRSVGDATAVRYYLERGPKRLLPGSLAMSGPPQSLRIRGTVKRAYDTAPIRYKAVDVDGTVGYSNWFTIGSSDPVVACAPGTGVPVTWFTETPVKTKVPNPRDGSKGRVEYHVVKGNLPTGIALDAYTGYFTGKTAVARANETVVVRISVTDDVNTVNTECNFVVGVKFARLAISDITEEQKQHVRVGEPYIGQLEVQGGIEPYSVRVAASADLPSTLSFAPSDLSLSGTVSEPALPLDIDFEVANGDGNVEDGTARIYAHGPLSLSPVDAVSPVKRYDDEFSREFAYDATSVIPDVSGTTKQPSFNLSGALPAGLVLEDGKIKGETSAPEGVYGPFTISISDFSGDRKTSSPFTIVVGPRDPMEQVSLEAPAFVVEMPDEQKFAPLAIEQPGSAGNLVVTWSLIGPALPNFLSFDPSTGEITASADIPYAKIGKYGPYRLKATDSEQSSVTSEEFEVSVADWLPPEVAFAGKVEDGNVSGDPALGQTRYRYVGPRPIPDETTFIGGAATAKFVETVPPNPAGLTLDPVTGVLSGYATSEYSGPVEMFFTDGRNRKGSLRFDLNILEYPSVTMEAAYSVPRLSKADDTLILPQTNAGFIGTVDWALAPASTPLPEGLTVAPTTGAIVGKTLVKEGVFAGLRLQATDNKTKNVAVSNAFTINVTPRVPMMVSYPNPVTITMERQADKTYKYVGTDSDKQLPVVSGSSADPLAFSIPALPDGLKGMTIDPATGALVGDPGQLGEWVVTVLVKDADSASVPATVTLKSTLDGPITTTNKDYSADLRLGESFKTQSIAVSATVGTPVFSIDPALLPKGLSFAPLTGVLSGRVDAPFEGSFAAAVAVTDNDKRGFKAGAAPRFLLKIKQPLKVATSNETEYLARQYSATEQVDVRFPKTVDDMGEITWSVSGDLPGTLVSKRQDKDGKTFFSWTAGGSSYEVEAVSGLVAFFTRDRVSQAVSDTSPETYLPLDALVLDVNAGTLKGIPSKSGTFGPITPTAHDSHADAYFDKSDPTRAAYNTASGKPFTITVSEPLPLEIAADTVLKPVFVPGGDANLVPYAVNPAYGKMASWSLTGAEALPEGIVTSVSPAGIVFSGYSAQYGSYAVRATGTDAAGRSEHLDLTFRVLETDAMIGMTYADIETKAGIPFTSYVPEITDAFGPIRFGSEDIRSTYQGRMSISSTTGVISGKIDEVGDYVVNVSVTDETSRVTSKPVTVKVLPNIRIFYPQTVVMGQGASSLPPQADYAIGALAFSKGAGTWPTDLTVNAANGRIVATTGIATGVYPDLSVVARDSNGDEQSSNVFAVQVNAAKKAPVLVAVSDKQYTLNSLISVLTPSVTNKAATDVYTLSGTLPNGLVFNDKTGAISGTPREIGAFKVSIKVTDVNNQESVTPEFFIKVKSNLPLVVEPALAARTFSLQTNFTKTVQMSAPAAYGKVTYKRASGSIASTVSEDGVVVIGPRATAGANQSVVVTATDEAGTTVNVTFTINVVDFSVTPNDVAVINGAIYSDLAISTISGQEGSVTYQFDGLPEGLTYSRSSGLVSGMPAAEVGGYTVTVTATDDITGAFRTVTVRMSAVAEGGGAPYRYWRLWAMPGSNYLYIGDFNTFKTTSGTTVTMKAITNGAPELATITRIEEVRVPTSSDDAQVTLATGSDRFALTMDFGAAGTSLAGFKITNPSGIRSSKKIFGAITGTSTTKPFQAYPELWLEKSNDLNAWVPVTTEFKTDIYTCSGGSCGHRNDVRIGY